MRRKRRQLQVSTFPFMAVLLCAMGSLILLLLLLDRRAKLAARNQVKQSQEKAERDAQRRRDEILATRKREWEQRKQELHARLLRQDAQVLTELQHVHHEQSATQNEIEKQRQTAALRQQQLQQSEKNLMRVKSAVQQKMQQLDATRFAVSRARTDLDKLAGELLQLEKVIDELRQLRHRRKDTYSVMPYRGKRGESHKPLYVECTANSVVIHPGQKALRGLYLTKSLLREELRRRLQAHHAQHPNETKPYVFLMVRPGGVKNYYAVQSILPGLGVDFGYELIEAAWHLDFSGNSKIPATVLSEYAGVSANSLVGPIDVRRYLTKSPLPGIGTTPRANRLASAEGSFRGAGQSQVAKSGVAADTKWKAYYPGRMDIPVRPNAENDGGTGMSILCRRDAAAAKPKALGNGKPHRRTDIPVRPNAENGGRTGMSILRGGGGGKAAKSHGAGVAKSPAIARPRSRDWYIPIECHRDSVVLPLSRERFTADQLAAIYAGEHLVATAVRRIILRRRARQADGITYRPIIRFEVHPDGLRTYHRVYPLMERLALPMVRYNIQPPEPDIFEFYQK